VTNVEFQAGIAASFETQRQERNNMRTAEEVNQVLLERAMEVYGEAGRRHVYSEAKLEVYARY
jgi:hypothetical protein